MSKGSTVATVNSFTAVEGVTRSTVVVASIDSVDVASAIDRALAFVVKEKIKTKVNRVSRRLKRLSVFDMFVLYSLDKEVARGSGDNYWYNNFKLGL